MYALTVLEQSFQCFGVLLIEQIGKCVGQALPLEGEYVAHDVLEGTEVPQTQEKIDRGADRAKFLDNLAFRCLHRVEQIPIGLGEPRKSPKQPILLGICRRSLCGRVSPTRSSSGKLDMRTHYGSKNGQS